MNIASRAWLIAAVLATPLAAFAQQPALAPRPITIDDHFQIREVEGPKAESRRAMGGLHSEIHVAEGRQVRTAHLDGALHRR